MEDPIFIDFRPESAKQAERERIESEEYGELPMTLFGIPVVVDGKPITRPEFDRLPPWKVDKALLKVTEPVA